MFPLHMFGCPSRRSGQDEGGTAEEGKEVLLVCPAFRPSFLKIHYQKLVSVRGLRMVVSVSLFSASFSSPARFYPFTCTIWSPKGGRALFPLPESSSTSSQFPLVVPWPHAGRSRAVLMEGFLHAVWSQL